MNWQEVFFVPIQETWTKILSFVPNMLAALVILVVGWVIARIIGALVARALRLARFDNVTDRVGINQALTDAKITSPPSRIVGKLFFWLVMLMALVMAVNSLGLTVATELLNDLLRYIPNVIAATFVFALGLFFASLARAFVQTVAGSVRAVSPETLGKVAQAAVIIFAVAASLEQLRIAPTIVTNAFTLLLGALALGLGLAFGLGCKDIVRKWVEDVTHK